MAHPLRKLLEEALCPICLEYFNDPVSMDCGHNFCRFCITEYYEKLEIEEEGVFCPQCRSKLKKEKSQTNRQLARMVENIQQLGIKPEDLKKQTVCREHEDKLKLFCEDDGEVICLLCDKTQEHGSHTLVPIEDAAQEYKVKLHNDIERLKKAKEEISKLKSKEQNKPKDWKERVKCQRQRISSEFEKLQLLLNEEKKLFLQGLAEEERETLKKLNENVTKLSQQSFSLQQLITEMEKKCQQPAAELLQDVKGTLARSEQVRLQEPELSAAELKDAYGVPGIMEVLQEFTALGLGYSKSRKVSKMTESEVQKKLELAKLAAEEKRKEHERALELKEKECEAQNVAHERALELERLEKDNELAILERKKQNPNVGGSNSPYSHQWEWLFPAYEESTDITEYFITFERLCTIHSIPDTQKMIVLVAKLTGRALDIFNKMPIGEISDYGKFKDLVLKQFQITPETYRVKFRTLKREAGLSNVAYVNQMKGLLEKWVKGRGVTSFEEMCDLLVQEQFLTRSNDDINQCLWDKKVDSAENLASYADQYEQFQTVIEAGQIRTRQVEVAEGNNPGHSLGGYQKGCPEPIPYHRGQPKVRPMPQGKPQIPYRSTTPFSRNPPRPSDQSAGRCFKCNELGHVKANCPKNPNRLQLIALGSHQRSSSPDASQIPPEQRETVSVGRKKVIAWRDTGAQVSAIHQSLVDSKFINPEVQVTIQPFKSNCLNLPTARLPVQYKGWSGMWTFAVYDDDPIPMLLGEDLANHVKLAKEVGMVTCSQAEKAFTPIPVPEPSTRALTVFPETQTEVVEPDSRPTSTTAIVNPGPETQPEPVQEPELVEQPVPGPLPALDPALATPSANPTPEGTTEPALAAAKPAQEAHPEPEILPSAPVESSSQSTETTPSPTSLPERPSPSPQPSEELMSPASRKQFQAEQEADESLKGAWTAAQSDPPPLRSSYRSREFKVLQFTAQERDDAEWPESVYYEGKSDGGVEEVNLSMTLGRMQRQQIKELCTSFAPLFSATPGRTKGSCHFIDTELQEEIASGVEQAVQHHL